MNLVERELKCTADLCIEATVVSTDNSNMLLLASSYAATAKDALGVVANKMHCGCVLAACGNSTIETVFCVDTHFVTELLELAVAASLTAEALLIMNGKQHFQSHLSGFDYFRGICEDFHAFVNRIYASRYKGFCALNLDHAHTASADLVDILQVAKSRNVYSGFSCSLKDGAASSNLVGHAVDLNIYHIHVYTLLPYLFSIALNLHLSMQTPHLMHFVVSITCGCFTEPVIAPTGQLRAQSVQPLHLSSTTT